MQFLKVIVNAGEQDLNRCLYILQRNQAGSGPAMPDLMGFKQCMEYLLGCGISITSLIYL